MINKETMVNLIEIKNPLEVKFETLEKETNKDPIEIIHINKSLETSKDEGFENKASDTSIHYHHPNYKGHQ